MATNDLTVCDMTLFTATARYGSPMDFFVSGIAPPRLNDAPVVTVISPSVDSVIEQFTQVVFEVTDEVPEFTRIMVVARFQSFGIYEVVHNGNRFGDSYSGGLSTRMVIPKGYKYSVVRDGGWIASPVFEVFAIDSYGSEAA